MGSYKYSNEPTVTLYAVYEKDGGILKYIADSSVNESKVYSTSIMGVNYNFEVTYLKPDNISNYGGTYEQSTNTYTVNDLTLGTAEGVQTLMEDSAQAMAVLKCDGNLVVNGTITTSTYSTTVSGVVGDVTKIKGLLIYCSGELTNNGKISQTARGTYNTEGEDIYLWSNGVYDDYIVPAVGASGGAGGSDRSLKSGRVGQAGSTVGKRATRWRRKRCSGFLCIFYSNSI